MVLNFDVNYFNLVNPKLSNKPRFLNPFRTSREQFKIIFANGVPGNHIISNEIGGPVRRVKIDGVTIVTPSENQNFTDKDARSVKRPKLGSFGKSKTLREFSENAIKKNLSRPSVHFLPDATANDQQIENIFNAEAEKLVQIKPIASAYIAPSGPENSKGEYVKALAYTVKDEYYDENDYSYYEIISEYEDTDDDTRVDPRPEKTLGHHIPLSRLKLNPHDQPIISGNNIIKNSHILVSESDASSNDHIDTNHQIHHHRNCTFTHFDDDTDEDPFPESFDPMALGTQSFLPINGNKGRANSAIEAEAHLHQRPHRRPQRYQKKKYGRYKNRLPFKRDLLKHKSFKPSIKGPTQFFPSIEGKPLNDIF